MDATDCKRVVQMAIRFELDPNREQTVLLAKSVGASRYVYNWGLAESLHAYERTGRRLKLRELKGQLVELKKTECPWLYDVSAHIGQQALHDLDRAFDRFFAGAKGDGPRSGHPRFKRKGVRDSARLYEVTLEERHIRLPKIGRVRLKETRSDRGFEGRILSATIRHRADRWFVSLCVERPAFAQRQSVRTSKSVVGIDLGLRSTAVVFDGVTRVVAPHKALERDLKKLRRLDRELARRQPGSQNREKARRRLARLHYRIACRRQDHLHSLSSHLARTKSVIVVEDLNVAGMLRNRHLSRAITDAGMGEFRRQLTYKCDWYGSTLIVANRWFPSTKTCSSCGFVKRSLSLGERIFSCDSCGFLADRDENAAMNLRRLGLRVLGGELPEGLREVTPVERKALASIEAKPASLKQEASGPRRSQRTTQRRDERLAGAASSGGYGRR